MEELRLDGLSVKIYRGANAKKKFLIYFPGFPGPIPGLNPKQPLAPQLSMRLSMDIVAPEYAGLGGSEGHFCFSRTIRDSSFVFDRVNEIYSGCEGSILGYSWGALPALNIWRGLKRTATQKLILLAPAMVYPGRSAMLKIATTWLKDFESVLGSYDSPDAIVEDIEFTLDTVQPLQAAQCDSDKITIIHGQRDEVVPIQASKKVVELNTEMKLVEAHDQSHDFEDRTRLSEVICSALDC